MTSIPVRQPLAVMIADGYAAIGDSAFMAIPINGSGIGCSMRAGKMLADAVIADAYMKGIRNFDVSLAYEAMRKDAMTPPDADTQRRYGDRDRSMPQGFFGRLLR